VESVAVVGHVEWVHFLRVPRLPRTGEIMRAERAWAGPAGGGAMAAFEMRRLGAHTHFFTAHGDDPVGERVRAGLDGCGLVVHAARRAATPHPEVFTYLTDDHERTITLLGAPLAPEGADRLGWDGLGSVTAVYFCKGDAAALVAARRAPVLVATARAMPILAAAHVPIDVLVASDNDASEIYTPGDLDPPPMLVVRTAGGAGGSYRSASGETGTFPPAPLPGPIVDSYGAGDSFAAALTVALGRRLERDHALAMAARAGAAALTRAGAG
jgi:ribokinase